MNQQAQSLDTKRLYCNRCRGETNHFRRGQHVRKEVLDFEDGAPTDWMNTAYSLWTCAGCERAVMETEASSSFDTEDDGPAYSYDPPVSRDDLKMKVFRKLPKRLRGIYRQTVKSYNVELNILCAAGLRALIEGICAEKGATGRNLEKRIDALEAHLPKSIVENLHEFRFMGNVALHELTAPERNELKIAIEVSEDLLNILYELDYKASLLRKSRTSGKATS